MSTVTNLGQFTNNINPSVTCTGTFTTVVAAGDKIVATLFICTSMPSNVILKINDGTDHFMSEIPAARASRASSGFILVSFYMDSPGFGAGTKTVTATWTNGNVPGYSGLGGGSLMTIATITPTTTFKAGPPECAAFYSANTLKGATTLNGGHTFPTATVTVASTTGFTSNGVIQVGGRPVFYTGTTATTFTGCQAFFTGTIATGAAVVQSPYSKETPTARNAESTYVAWSALGINFNVAAQETPDNAFTALPQNAGLIGSRSIMLDVATKDITAPAGIQSHTWTPTWAAAHNWISQFLLFGQTVAGAPAISVAPAVTGTPAVGSTLSTTNGTWTNTPTSFTYQWWRDCGTTAARWQAIGGATASTYSVIGDDLGSQIRCEVTAANATGHSFAAASNATSVVPAPSGQLTYRIVTRPTAQADAQNHMTPLTLPVLPGDLMVLFVGCSNANLLDGNLNKSDVGSVADSGGNTWIEYSEAFSNANITNSAQVFHAQCPNGLAYGSWINMTVRGMANGGAQGTAAGYHGQSPQWFVVAVSTGDGTTLSPGAQAASVSFNATTHTSQSISVSGKAVVFGLHVGAPAAATNWWTPTTSGMIELLDNPASNDQVNSYSLRADPDTFLILPDNGGESGYALAAEGQAVTSGFSGTTAGTTPSFNTLSDIIVGYSIATGGSGATYPPTPGVLVPDTIKIIYPATPSMHYP